MMTTDFPAKNNRQKLCWILGSVLFVLSLLIIIFSNKADLNSSFDDNIDMPDPSTLTFNNGHVSVTFSDVLLSKQKETRKLIVSEQDGTVSIDLKDRVFSHIDISFLTKTQTVSYTGKGYFVVDLDQLSADNLIQDDIKKVLTIKIGHAYLQAIEIDPNNIIIDEVDESLLARGDIKLSLKDFNEIEKGLRDRLEAEFNTVGNGQTADDNALKMVRAIYEPIVQAIDDDYTVIVEFK